jgi:hypothetical protein
MVRWLERCISAGGLRPCCPSAPGRWRQEGHGSYSLHAGPPAARHDARAAAQPHPPPPLYALTCAGVWLAVGPVCPLMVAVGAALTLAELARLPLERCTAPRGGDGSPMPRRVPRRPQGSGSSSSATDSDDDDDETLDKFHRSIASSDDDDDDENEEGEDKEHDGPSCLVCRSDWEVCAVRAGGRGRGAHAYA